MILYHGVMNMDGQMAQFFGVNHEARTVRLLVAFYRLSYLRNSLHSGAV